MRIHLHISFLHAFVTFLEFLIAWIPVKLVAANYDGKNGVASAVLHVL